LKPDCLQRGLEGEIVIKLENSGFQVLQKVVRMLEKDEVLNLYKEHFATSTFPDLVEYMLSGPSMILLLTGIDAIARMSQLKGRTGSGRGIRGMYAENFIRNIIHSAETELKTGREISMFFKLEDVTMLKNRKKVIFGLSGMTECGKSTAGMFFDAHGVKRIKMINVLDLLRAETEPNLDLETFVNREIKQNPVQLRQLFTDKLLAEMDRTGIRFCSLESMGDPEMVLYLRARLPGEFFSLYVDASLEKRLQHQMIRKNLTDLEEAKRILIPKDDFKTTFWKMPQIMGIADVVVDNNGTLEAFQMELESLLEQHGIKQ